MLQLLIFTFPEGCYFFNCDNTELKRSSKIIFSVSERHRWAVVGYDNTSLVVQIKTSDGVICHWK